MRARRMLASFAALVSFAMLGCLGSGTAASLQLSPPSRLRPCCAFGDRLGIRLAGIPLPVRLDNAIDPNELGPHRYDGGIISLNGSIRQGFLTLPADGMAYTCRGGFIDTAHVRDYADWTFFFWTRVAKMIDHGGRIELPEEGGQRVVYVVAADPQLLASVGREEYAIRIAEWLAFELSIWHETATWFGWSASAAFPERASAFSPEDLYSNRVGVRIAGRALRAGGVRSVEDFEAAVDAELRRRLEELGVVSRETTRLAVASVDRTRLGDGGWWDSMQLLPASDLVRHRYVWLGPEIVPWRIPPGKRSPELAEALGRECSSTAASPAIERHDDRVGDVPIAALARLDVRPDDSVARGFPMPDPESRWIAQTDLRRVVETVRRQVQAWYGPDADRP